MMSKLNVVVRDALHPCKPYSSSSHSFLVAVFNCDLTLLLAKPLTGVGPGGGRIYGEFAVPSGCYLLVGYATCKNVVTNWTMVVAGCGEDVCVNLIPRRFEQCVSELHTGISAAIAAAASGYSFSSPEVPVGDELRKALEAARASLASLARLLPRYEQPLTADMLKRAEAPKELLELWK